MTPVEAKEQFLRALGAFPRQGMEDLKNALLKTDFFEQPASSRFHGNFVGGLAIHSVEVMRQALNLVEAWPVKVPTESVILCSLLHDVCKIGAYKTEKRNRKDARGQWESYDYWTYADDPFPLGHGEKSLIWISRFVNLFDDEMLAIRWHMGAYEDGSMTALSAAMRNPLVLLIHTADMVASKLIEETRA